MKNLETIISNKEVKRRTNIRTNIHHKAKRRNELGLTKRQQEKENTIMLVKKLLTKGLGVKAIARELNINISAVSRIKNNKY
ncbi:hypothetical protein K144316041_p10350 (plasmid) [Clostridium tetani]|uniref:hypothetical protein n=1 Tax=Clostridium tetani TaxID=1513 RepID=UPI001FB06924|nr:hypothetical protein [Clostridium tetani]BDR74107.1 hypothetical protein K144316041_p10350 [Clostridium tetani]